MIQVVDYSNPSAAIRGPALETQGGYHLLGDPPSTDRLPLVGRDHDRGAVPSHREYRSISGRLRTAGPSAR